MTKAAENLEKKIEAQLEKLKQLKARKQAIEAREKSKQKEQQRKDDTRRKILLGSYLIKKMQDNKATADKILAELKEYLTEDRDRKLFNLPPVDKAFYTFKKEFSSYEQASQFLRIYIQPLLKDNSFTQASITKRHGLNVLKVTADASGDNCFELMEIFGKPVYAKGFVEDLDKKSDDGRLKTVDDDYDIINVELDGYPANYDRSSINYD